MKSAATATPMEARRMPAPPPLRSLSDLPPEMLLEIFVRLSPEEFVRCGSVCKAWLKLTADRLVRFQHHHRQPRQYHLITFVREAGFMDLGVADFCIEKLDLKDHKLGSIVRFADTLPLEAAAVGSPFQLHGSVQGVLLLSHYDRIYLCNPTTQRWAQVDSVHINSSMVGLYMEPVMGEFRILYRRDSDVDNTSSYFVFEIVSGINRMVYQQEATFHLDPAPVHLSNRLCWLSVPILPGAITIFNIAAEVFESLPTPSYNEKHRLLRHQLIDLGGDQLAISIAWREATQDDLEGPSSVDLWVWEHDAWILKCRVQLPVPSILQFVADDVYWTASLVSLDGDVIVEMESCIVHYDRQGNPMLALYSEKDCLEMSPFVLKESVIPYPYMRLNGPPDSAPPFFRWL